MEDFLRRLLFTMMVLPLSAWFFMLCEGGLASRYGWPTISFGYSVVACIGLAALLCYPLSSITYELIGLSKDDD